MWWNAMTVFQQVVFIIACIASAILVIQLVMMFIGGASDSVSGGGITDADVSDIGGVADVGGISDISDISDASDGVFGEGLASVLDSGSGGGADGSIGGHIDGDTANVSGRSILPFGLRLLSLRSIIAFLAVGGWVGYTLGYALDWYIAFIIALACGFAAACGMAAAMIGMEKLQSNGNINPINAVGKTGTVYLTIPPRRSGYGKINVLIQERYAEYDAVSDSDEPIPTSAEIKIIGYVGSNVLLVEKYRKSSIVIENQK